MAQPILVLGTHVFAEEVADLIAQVEGMELAGFVENQDRTRCLEPLLGLPVHWVDDIASLAGDHEVLCAIGTTARNAYVEYVADIGFRFAVLVHPAATVAPSATLGAGCIVSAGVIVGSHTMIADQVILNRGVLVGHHTTIGRYVTVSPGANVAGLVRIGDGAYIGMGATVLERRTLGASSLVAAGSLVTRDVPANVEVRGSPARIVREGVNGR